MHDGPAVDDLVFDGLVVVNGFKKLGAGQMRLTGNTQPAGVGYSIQVEGGTLVLARTLADTGIFGTAAVFPGASLVLDANEQISHGASNIVLVRGTFDLAGFNETMDDLTVQSEGAVIPSGGTLAMRNLTLWGATLTPASGLVTISGAIKTLGAPLPPLQSPTPTALLGGNVILAADKSFDVENGAVATDLEVSLAMGGTSLTKIGAGTMLLSGAANTYTGTTTVSGGVLALGNSSVDGAVPGDVTVTSATVQSVANEQIATSGLVTLNAGGLLDLNGFTETIGSLMLNGGAVTMGAGTLVVTGSITQSASAAASISGRLNLSGGTRTITSNDVPAAAIDLDISAEVINGGILKQGAGTLRLGGSSTFAAGFHHPVGKLLIGHDSALGTGTLSLEGGAIEADGGARNILNPVIVASLSTVSGLNALTFGGSFTTNLGAALLKSGAGTLTIAGPQTHASGSTLFATVGTVNFYSSATGATLGVNVSNAGTLVSFNADQDLNTLVVNDGHATAGGASLLNVNNLSVDNDATLEFEIGGLIAGDEFGQMNVTGNAGLSGTFDITRTPPSPPSQGGVGGVFEPDAGQSFVILTFGSRSGAFDQVTGMAAGPGKVFRVQYNPTDVTLIVGPPAPGDFDVDGDVDGDDFDLFKACAARAAVPYAPTCTLPLDGNGHIAADFDQDADADGDDFGIFQRCISGESIPADPNCAM